MECALHLGKNVSWSSLELHKLATDKNDPHLFDFIETHYLDKQVKSIKQLSDHLTNVHKMPPPPTAPLPIPSGRNIFLTSTPLETVTMRAKSHRAPQHLETVGMTPPVFQGTHILVI